MNKSRRVLLPLLLVVAGLAAAPFALACSPPAPLATPRSSFTPAEPSVGSLVVSDGVQSGAMGEIHEFIGAATHHEGSYYGTSGGSVRLDSEGDGWWVMSRLDISGDLGGAAFAPGTHRVYTSGISDDPSDPSSMSVTGCSGPTYGNYTFDTQADTVEVTVSAAGATARRIDYVTTYSGQITRGSFVYQLPSEPGSTTLDGRGI